MASQIGTTRIYSSTDEATDPRRIKCPLCKVTSVPRGIIDSGKNELGKQEKHCANCGHVHGRKNH